MLLEPVAACGGSPRSIDQEHTFEGLVRAFEGFRWCAPGRARTDRMGALGESQGRRFTLHPPATELARFHGCEIPGLSSP